MTGAAFRRRAFRPPLSNPNWDHEHCSFCWAKFMTEGAAEDLEILSEGYVTEDDHWVCDRCFADFREEFGWTVSAGD